MVEQDFQKASTYIVVDVNKHITTMKIGPRCRVEPMKSGIYRVVFYDRHGSPTRKGITLETTDQVTAISRAKKLFDEWQRGLFDPWRDVYKVSSVMDAIRHYEKERGSELKRATLRKNVRKFLKFCEDYKVEYVGHITPLLLRQCIYSYENEQTRLSRYRHLSAVISWLHGAGYFEKNPLDEVTRPRQPKRVPKYWTLSEVERIFIAAEHRQSIAQYHKNMKNPRWFMDGFYFSLYTGARAEACGMAVWGDVYDDRIIIHGEKVSEDRPVPDVLVRPLLDELEARTRLSTDPYEPILKNGHLTRVLSYDYLGEKLKQVVDMCKLENKGLKGFRHAFAINMLNAGMSIAAIQKMMGHKDISTTMIYLSLADDDVINEAKRKLSRDQ